MQKQKTNNLLGFHYAFRSPSKRRLAVFALFLVVVSFVAVPRIVQAVSCSNASDCQQQINNLNNLNSQTQQSLNSLSAQASDYQSTLVVLQTAISSLQNQIATNQAQQESIQQQIANNEQQIATKKQSLGELIKTMYIDGQMTTIEQLATSNDLSSYVDKQAYRETVQNTLKSTLDQIAAVQITLHNQKSQVESLLAGEVTQNNQLVTTRSQQDQLLNYNQSQQDQFSSQLSANKSAIAELQRQQYALNVRTFGLAQYGGTGGYPWADAVYGGDLYVWKYNGGALDPLGWYYRNCTSYAFWRLAQARGIMLPWGDFPHVYNAGGGIGYSIPDFRNLGYVVDNNPKDATLAVFGAGPYGSATWGHIMYVESSTATSAYVSQYNYAGDGRYSTITIYPRSDVYFIHIP